MPRPVGGGREVVVGVAGRPVAVGGREVVRGGAGRPLGCQEVVIGSGARRPLKSHS